MESKPEPESGNGNMVHSFQQSMVSLLQPQPIPIPVSVLLGNVAISVLWCELGENAVHSSSIIIDPCIADFFLLASPWDVLH